MEEYEAYDRQKRLDEKRAHYEEFRANTEKLKKQVKEALPLVLAYHYHNDPEF